MVVPETERDLARLGLRNWRQSCIWCGQPVQTRYWWLCPDCLERLNIHGTIGHWPRWARMLIAFWAADDWSTKTRSGDRQRKPRLPVEGITLRLRCIRCGFTFKDEWLTPPRYFYHWRVPKCPECGTTWYAEVNAKPTTGADKPQKLWHTERAHPELTTYYMPPPEDHQPRCCICGTKTPPNWQVCSICYKALGLAGIPYREWPSWIRGNSSYKGLWYWERKARGHHSDYRAGWRELDGNLPTFDERTNLLRFEPYEQAGEIITYTLDGTPSQDLTERAVVSRQAVKMDADALNATHQQKSGLLKYGTHERKDGSRRVLIRCIPALIHISAMARDIETDPGEYNFAEDETIIESAAESDTWLTSGQASGDEHEDYLSAMATSAAPRLGFDAYNPAALLEFVSNAMLLYDAIADLPPLHREIVELLAEGHSRRAIARRMGIDRDTVQARINDVIREFENVIPRGAKKGEFEAKYAITSQLFRQTPFSPS